ncbi:MAG: AhpC/TSA family protein [Gammaproteobacteria bacterium]|nr:AhpC/TSA family protein [Chromatiales bacterium]MYA31677.1 AhpC/TSA family protein [Gammaproteobacteria bacterium]MYE48861.1 AhpC/TSA family protein [Gammaproteobacteria bacterium]MYF66711.1 AhpC/TSA family protein [Gammaproteobacteria bacterium]MYK36977.1 AhpC/TSA family protein [Gammaproteobacteria bacterium]
MKSRRLIPALAALALAGCMQPGEDAGQAGDPNRYTIAGDLSAVCESGEFALWTADGRNIVEGARIVDGRIFLEGVVDAPANAFLEILNATSREGYRLASIKGHAFVLEPGELTLTMDSRTEFVVQGGRYNDIVVNSWRLSPEYLRVRDDYLRADRPVDGETSADRLARETAAAELFDEMLRLESQGRRRVALGHADPLARKLTIQSTWLRSPWITDALRQLAEMIPHDPWVAESLALEEAYAAEQARAASFGVGSEIREFEAETLDGEIVSVSGAREGKDVVLLEFWASWCGPCRVEIPHMKEAYARYGPLGFEILSFTVDDLREDWVEASEEEDLPWINAGMGIDHPATEAYGVTGVPANFLVEAASGRILARNLRGRKLDEALAERFDTPEGES